MVRIDDPEVERLVDAIARHTGETTTEVVVNALRERLEREEARALDVEQIVEEAMAIGRHCAALPVLDAQSPDELLGYDECGLPN
jgi:antitoxin VapB